MYMYSLSRFLWLREFLWSLLSGKSGKTGELSMLGTDLSGVDNPSGELTELGTFN
ncbi:MAG: hypothetical protein LUF29_05530 [Oscillospiraceae bacterium]|nr:hypothetical protein [Oscillospiraceae bacterium]